MDRDPLKTLSEERDLSDETLAYLLNSSENDESLFLEADRIRRQNYGDRVFLRGLIEFTNYCRNDCCYCGIRKSNKRIQRYRLDKKTILECCKKGYDLGFRTFVLQGGEDPRFTDDVLSDIVTDIRERFAACAITISAGERTRAGYEKLFRAGASRYLLRHEAASKRLYDRLHPAEMKLEERKRCLYDLKETGFQVGAGLMVGAPFQTVEDLVEDIRFMQDLDPDMIGIGPFMHHVDTPLGHWPDGSLDMTLRLVALSRILFPHALIPSTTALASIDPEGRVRGLKAGANVIMPNLSPPEYRENYSIYNNKRSTGLESAEGLDVLREEVAEAGYRIVTDRGDVRR